MHRISGFDHQAGRHCGSAALRNLAEFYGWSLSEPVCFGIGGGISFVAYDHQTKPWRVFRGNPAWLERAFFDHLEIPHLSQEGESRKEAWDDVTSHLDGNDPVLLHLDPAELGYLPDGEHLPPHSVLAVGYSDDSVLLSDGRVPEVQEVPLSALESAWTFDRYSAMSHGYVVVTRNDTLQDMQTAATRGIRETVTYMLNPQNATYGRQGPGAEGIPAFESFASDVADWTTHSDPGAPARDALRSIRWHDEDSALRGLYADAIDELSSWARVGGGKGDQMRDIAREWRTVADLLAEASGSVSDPTAELSEAASLLGDIADSEERFFQRISDEL